jgi:NAD(P)-dependent dehydrogenase (short-subunit alcohol dehydrogenase family)
MGKLDGKVAYITGAAMGIGEGIARVLAEHGAHVLLADILDEVFNTAKSIEAEGNEATAYKVDVTRSEEVKKSVDDALNKYEKIDILVNNAGVSKKRINFLETSDEFRDFHFNVNINGVWNCTKVILPNMIKQKYGKIVIISSVTGTMVADEGQVTYATTKAAVLGFTKALAREVAKDNINVNAICPGYIMTPLVKRVASKLDPGNPQSVIDGIASTIPMGRLGKVEEIGELAAFLSSDESSYITGTQIVIDGGSTLPETNVSAKI